MTDREAFEAWAKDRRLNTERWGDECPNPSFIGQYKGLSMELAWAAWQAARKHHD
jgi:hypothetical protein